MAIFCYFGSSKSDSIFPLNVYGDGTSNYPETAKENDIFIEGANAFNNIYYSFEKPVNPEDNDAWFYQSPTKATRSISVKMGNIYLALEFGTCKMYNAATSTWNNVKYAIYKNGEWDQSVLYVYSYGVMPDFPSTAIQVANSNVTVDFAYKYLGGDYDDICFRYHIKSGGYYGASFTVPVDTTNYNKVLLLCQSEKDSDSSYVRRVALSSTVSTGQAHGGGMVAITGESAADYRQLVPYEIDISSLTGEYYLRFYTRTVIVNGNGIKAIEMAFVK